MQHLDKADLLRSWYLACLRRTAWDIASRKLTPAALINADKKHLESLVLAEIDPPCSAQPALQSTSPVQTARLVALFTMLIIGIFVCANPSVLQPEIFKAVIIAFITLMACQIFASERELTKLRKFRSSMHHKLNEQASACNDEQTLQAIDKLMSEKTELASGIKLIADLSPIFLFSVDKDFTITATNTSASRDLGYEPLELEQINFPDILFGEDRTRTLEAMKASRAAGQSANLENRLIARDGKPIDLRWSIEWSETSQCYFGSAENITSNKTLQRAKEEFVAMIGHDINTPLGAIRMSIQSLEAGIYGALPPEAQSTARAAEQTVNRLIGLLNELLEYETANAGKLSLKKESLSIVTLVEEAVLELREPAQQMNLAIELDLPNLQIEADRGKLFRVLINLLSNAIKHSPPGGTIRIKGSKSSGALELRVTDQGPGIDKENQLLIFERYARVQSETSKNVTGTGLGLPIARAIIDSHGGLTGVESKPGSGSTFWFTLPTA